MNPASSHMHSNSRSSHRFVLSAVAATAGLIFFTVSPTWYGSKSSLGFVDRSLKQPSLSVPPVLIKEKDVSVPHRKLLAWSQDEEEVMMGTIREKLKPTTLIVDENNVLEPKQFLHLHHMKSGGTSVDELLKCARERLHKDMGYEFNHYSIHECARGAFRRCMQNSTDVCREPLTHAGTMSFCSALKHLPTIDWNDLEHIKAITILRNPIDRVWSMYRFETRMCYNCKNLTEIYEKIDRGDTFGMDSLCLAQLQNHETANLLSSEWPEGASDDEIVAEAIENLKSFFTVIGLTEELTLSAQILGTVFPWINKTIEGSKVRCSLPHANSSPDNNHCVQVPRTDGGKGYLTYHWDLPSHPDETTRAAIEAHNQLDIKLYEAAVQYFELQKRVYEENESTSRREKQ